MKNIILLLLLVAAIEIPVSMNAQNKDTITTKSGLKYYYTNHGNGEKTKQGWLMLVHYTGTFLDGSIFDSSRDRNVPFSFILGKGQVIKGWDEGISLLKVGDRATFIIPYELAYGEKGRSSIPPKSTLVFDVEVLDMKEKSLEMVIGDILFADTANINIKGAIDKIQELKKDGFKGMYVSEGDLNNIGYRLLSKFHNPSAAMQIMIINAELYPESANSYDSLGEACMENGDIAAAVKNYKKSLELDPKNKNAEEMLAKLKQK